MNARHQQIKQAKRVNVLVSHINDHSRLLAAQDRSTQQGAAWATAFEQQRDEWIIALTTHHPEIVAQPVSI